MAAKKELKKVKRGPAAASSLSAGRTMKMASPHCAECQIPNAPLNWYEFCQHDPFITRSEIQQRVPKVEDDPDVPGQRIVVGETVKLVYVESPNFTQVPIGSRFDGGNAFRIAVECGFKMPEELGYAPFCQYRDCWSQDLKVKTQQYGNYCSEIHAKLVIADAQEVLLDVTSDKRRQEQLSRISVS